MQFDEIERVIGNRLPRFAKEREAWLRGNPLESDRQSHSVRMMYGRLED